MSKNFPFMQALNQQIIYAALTMYEYMLYCMGVDAFFCSFIVCHCSATRYLIIDTYFFHTSNWNDEAI